jgi:hypothetical protein
MQIYEPVSHVRPSARRPEIGTIPSDTTTTADRRPERRARETPGRGADLAKPGRKPRLYGAGF